LRKVIGVTTKVSKKWEKIVIKIIINMHIFVEKKLLKYEKN